MTANGGMEFRVRSLVLLTSTVLMFVGASTAKDHNAMKPTHALHVVAQVRFGGMSEIDRAIQRRPGDKYYLFGQHSERQGVSIFDVQQSRETPSHWTPSFGGRGWGRENDDYAQPSDRLGSTWRFILGLRVTRG